jgi:hypothetical protein
MWAAALSWSPYIVKYATWFFLIVSPQKAKYLESWSRFDIPVDRYGGVHSLLICTSSILGSPTCHHGLASGIILIEQNIKKRTGPAREKRDLERKCRENIDILVKVVRWVQSRPASTVDSVLRSVAVQNLLRWPACYVHNRPPSPKFQIPPSQLRQRADRAASLSVKGLWGQHYVYSELSPQ